MIVLRKPRKVGHVDWHFAKGAGEGTAKTHISSPLIIGPQITCDVFSGEGLGRSRKNMGFRVVSVTHLPQDLRLVPSP